MAEPPGVSALGIETVEWQSKGHRSGTVVITGRWTRRPRWRGRPVLVIEEQGRRHRFPAIPEPPSLTGTPPGTWRMSFSIPESLGRQLGGRAWLQLGGVIVPLPEPSGLRSDQPPEEPAAVSELAAAAVPEPAAPPPRAPEPEVPARRAIRWLRRRPTEPGQTETPSGEASPDEAPQPAADPTQPSEPSAPAFEPLVVPVVPESVAPRRREPVTEPEQASAPEAKAEQRPEPTASTAQRPPEARAEDVLAAAAAQLGERIRDLEEERRAAEQRAHAEEARRIELEDEQVELTRKANRWRAGAIELAAAESRIRELELELREVGRRLEDAEQVSGEAKAERERTQVELENVRRSTWRGRLPAELEVARRPRQAPGRGGAAKVPTNGHSAERAREQLRREQETVKTGELDSWRDRTLQLERQLVDHSVRAERLYDVIDDLRVVLDLIRGVSPLPPLPDEDPSATSTVANGGQVVEPVRLDAALVRLRETIPAQPEEEPEPESNPDFVRALEAERQSAHDAPDATTASTETAAEGGPEIEAESGPETEATAQPPLERRFLTAPAPARAGWLLRVLRKLAKEDRAAAGRLVVQLLPAQGLVYAEPVAYDLALADASYVSVTSRQGETNLSYGERRREIPDIDFRVIGDLEMLARLVAAGRLRRRVGRQMPEIEGDRIAVSALASLVRAPVGLFELSAEGVRLDPWLTFAVIALMIRPKWTAGEQFTIAHRGPRHSTYLNIGDGVRPTVEYKPPIGAVATTIVSESDSPLPAILGQDAPGISVQGSNAPLAKIREWTHRAERG